MLYYEFKITNYMAFNEGGMASSLLIIALSIVFAAGFGFLVLHFIPGTPFLRKEIKSKILLS